MRFAVPLWLFALIPLIGMIVLQITKDRAPAIKFSDISIFKKMEHKSTTYLSKLVQYLRYVVLILLILTLAQPQIIDTQTQRSSKGIDIMLVLDTSGSMAAEDFQPKNRLEVAKETMKAFIAKRKTDRVGLIVFGQDAYTLSPLSTDYSIIGNFFDDIKLSMAGDGTAVGMAIATGLNRLKESEAKTKIIVLLTDGENNTGEIEPLRAAELARDIGIKIYTIGIGKEGGAKIPYIHPLYGKMYYDQPTYLDEETLQAIATTTKGTYFRATDSTTLKAVYENIDNLEKTKIKTNEFIQHQDLFISLIILIFILLIIEILLYNIFLVVAP